jgi:hypothetical protein
MKKEEIIALTRSGGKTKFVTRALFPDLSDEEFESIWEEATH